MRTNNLRPVIRIKLTLFDWMTEFVSIFFLVILIVLPLVFYGKLPDKIPVHFNAAGVPDDFGNRSTIWILSVAGGFMYLLFTVLQVFPQIYNFPVKITQENAAIQYKLASRLLRVLKSITLIIFSIISYQMIRIASGTAAGLGKAFLPVFLLITFGVIIIFIVQSLNNR